MRLAYTCMHARTHAQVAKTNKRLDWCHDGETPPVLLRIEEEERQAAERLGSRKKKSLTASQRRLR